MKTVVYRYYSTLRPIGPGTIPHANDAKKIVNFEERKFIPEIGKYSWGYVEYEKELDPEDCYQYNLKLRKNI